MTQMIELLEKFASISKQWFYEEPERRYELVKTNYQFFQTFFTKTKLEHATWEEMKQIGNHLHTLNTLPIAKGNAFGRPNHEINYYRQQFINLLNNNIPLQERIKKFKLAYFADNSLGELLGYIFPKDYAIFNQRSVSALEILNIPMETKRGEDFSEKFINFNKALTSLKQAYAEVVSAQTDLPLNLEIDQFLSWVQENHVPPTKTKSTFWAVNSIWSEGDQLERFKKQAIWEDGWSKNADPRDNVVLAQVKTGDIFVVLSSSTKGEQHNIPFTKIKAIGEVLAKNTEGLFSVNWINTQCYDIDNIAPYRGVTIRKMNNDKILEFVKKILTHQENVDENQNKTKTPLFPLNQILFGPPGTGKTYHTVTKAVEIIDGQVPEDYALAKQRFDALKQEGKIKFITFHQNYSYEDFMVGIRPVLNGTNIAYELHEGPFKQIADKARKDSASNYVLIIDEINRGNISKIFGELITLIENDKRAGNKHAISMPLMYHKNGEDEFSVPNNLYIIGTMNTADKSIALVDIALRRRFVFEEMMPNPALLGKIEDFDLPRWFSWLNTKITAELDRDHQIGHSYFIGLKSTAELQQVFYQCILPLLKEYFYGSPDKLKEIIPEIESDEKLLGEQLVQVLDKALHNETNKN